MARDGRMTRRSALATSGLAGLALAAVAGDKPGPSAPPKGAPAKDAAPGVQYTLYCFNNSTNPGAFCVYQNDPNIGINNVMSLAWFAKEAGQTTLIKFGWSIDYSFVWSQTGALKPGVTFDASQNWPADLTTTNQVTFDKVTSSSGGSYYTFEDQKAGPQPGSLTVVEGQNIAQGEASVGIGMSGSGTYLMQAQPNLNLTFTPHPVYFLTFGDYWPGLVLDTQQISHPLLVAFPANVYVMTATLNPDNTWTLTQGPPSSDLRKKLLVRARAR
jgi:hypothetical protein